MISYANDRTPAVIDRPPQRGAENYSVAPSVPDKKGVLPGKALPFHLWQLIPDLRSSPLPAKRQADPAAIDAAENQSEWSAPRTFTVTIHTAPANGAFTTDTTPTFTWVAVTGATYRLSVADNVDFTSPVIGPLADCVRTSITGSSLPR